MKFRGSLQRRSPLRWLWLVTLMFPYVGVAQTLFYGVDTGNDILTINPTTQATTLVGNTGLGGNFLEGLAASPGGLLFGTDGTGNLYSINPSTGAAALIGDTGRGDIEGLDFLGGTLLGVSFSATPTVFSINTTTGVATTIVTATSAMASGTRTAALYDANTMMITCYDSPHSLYSLNLTTGTLTFVGSLAVGSAQFLAMDFDGSGNLYGFGGDGNVWQINPLTASVALLGSTGGQFWLDATFAPVPEPATWALLFFGVGAIGWSFRRTRSVARD